MIRASTSRPSLGITPEGRLTPCPPSPNCVCSDATAPGHAIAPLRFAGDPEVAWQALTDLLHADPAFTIVERADRYLHAEARTRWLRFVDDVEFHLRPAQRQIAMRSASRVGYSDLGINRKRLEALRRALEDAV